MRARNGLRDLKPNPSHCIEPIGLVMPPTIHLDGNLSAPSPPSEGETVDFIYFPFDHHQLRLVSRKHENLDFATLRVFV